MAAFMDVDAKERIYSIDALRGFDFIWILGMDGLLHALAKAWPNGFTELMSHHVTHYATGVTFYDLVMPTFVFLSACSFPFWLASRERRGWSRRRIVLDVFRRLAMLKTWPRACAIAEVLWAGDRKPGYEDFMRRMELHRRRLIGHRVNCAPLQEDRNSK